MKFKLGIMFACLLLLASAAFAVMPPLRSCTLEAPLATLTSIPPAQLKPYINGEEAMLRVQGLVFQPSASKNIEADPTEDNSTAFRVVINYHRALHNGDIDKIASYWYPAEQERVKAHFSKPGVIKSAQDMFYQLENVELLGLLEIQGREVVYIRYTKTTIPFICVEADGRYYLASDPALGTPNAIACAAFDEGQVSMAAPE